MKYPPDLHHESIIKTANRNGIVFERQGLEKSSKYMRAPRKSMVSERRIYFLGGRDNKKMISNEDFNLVKKNKILFYFIKFVIIKLII